MEVSKAMAGELSKHVAPARAPMAPPVSESLGFAPLSESGIEGGTQSVCGVGYRDDLEMVFME